VYEISYMFYRYLIKCMRYLIKYIRYLIKCMIYLIKYIRYLICFHDILFFE